VKKRTKLPILRLFAALAIVALAIYGWYPKPLRVEIARATQGELQVTIDDDGETRVRERYTVISPLTGKLVRVTLHAGDPVVRGETELVAIEPTDPSLLDARERAESEARVKAAESMLSRALEAQTIAKESLSLANRELERGLQLKDSQSISAGELDQLEHRERIARAEVRSATFLVAIAEHEMALAKAALLTTQDSSYGAIRIQSPIDGVVLKVLREDAGFVAPGTALMEIGDPHDMELIIDVLSTAATKIRSGAHVHIEHWGGDNILSGTVRLVEPSAFLKISALGVEEKRVNVLIDFDSPRELRPTLGDGFRVEARIVIAQTSKESIKIPAGALVRERDDWWVVCMENGRAKRRAVTVGLSNGKEAEITSGLNVGDLVVLYPSDKIREGSRLVPVAIGDAEGTL
jgi:HlyD family secretion protein